MNVVLSSATSADRSVLARLAQLLLYDLSVVDQQDVNDHGLFTASELNPYVQQQGKEAFFIRVDESLVGFVLVGSQSPTDPDFQGHTVDAFFVLRRHRRRGIGRAAATALFNKLPGAWQIITSARHIPAQAFWRSMLTSYTGGNYQEHWSQVGMWRGHVQSFTTSSHPFSAATGEG